MSFPIPCRLRYKASMSDCNLPIQSCRSSVWSRQSALPDLSGKYPVPFLQASFLNFSISTTYFFLSFLDKLNIQLYFAYVKYILHIIILFYISNPIGELLLSCYTITCHSFRYFSQCRILHLVQ